MRWILSICVFFLVVFCVNAVLAYHALKGRSQLIEKQPYEKGLVYQKTIDEMQRAIDKSIDVTLSFLPEQEKFGVLLSARLLDKDGNAVENAKVFAVAKFAPEEASDVAGELLQRSPGDYVLSLRKAKKGVWLIDLSAEYEREMLRWKKKLVLH